ncbi:unnamed protein product [Pleuronectes platessa]|uniref:Uncharacterized protein n=1 Tax=Pleuronectes platessa TaxID=8262 RepID=A0A9N7VKS2_PLEPL|nr:unnamed protein product [Pleuronectes platessa]
MATGSLVVLVLQRLVAEEQDPGTHMVMESWSQRGGLRLFLLDCPPPVPRELRGPTTFTETDLQLERYEAGNMMQSQRVGGVVSEFRLSDAGGSWCGKTDEDVTDGQAGGRRRRGGGGGGGGLTDFAEPCLS